MCNDAVECRLLFYYVFRYTVNTVGACGWFLSPVVFFSVRYHEFCYGTSLPFSFFLRCFFFLAVCATNYFLVVRIILIILCHWFITYMDIGLVERGPGGGGYEVVSGG
jgi:hypothetical protein